MVLGFESENEKSQCCMLILEKINKIFCTLYAYGYTFNMKIILIFIVSLFLFSACGNNPSGREEEVLKVEKVILALGDSLTA